MHVAVLELPFVVGLQQDGADQADDGAFVGEYADDIGAAFDLLIQPFERVGNRYEDRGARSSGQDVWCWRMVRPSGTRGTGSTSVGRPIYSMSRELALVAGRPCDRPGCAVNADP